MRVLASLLLLAVWLARADAAAETCRSAGSFAWSAVTQGAWSDCTPSADDLFQIRAGHAVDVTGDLRQSGPAAGVRVDAGGTLRARVADDAIVLALGGAGLTCWAGSTCELRGGYRAFGGVRPRTLPAQATASYLRVGDVIPCPGVDASGALEPDCAGALATPGDRTRVRFAYAAPPRFVVDGLARVRADDGAGAGEDVLCFFDPDPADAAAPPDAGYCYRVTGAAGGDPAWIELDVRQSGWTGRDSNFPIARRLPVQLALASGVAAGAREIAVDGSLLGAGEDGLHEGAWIHFQADAEPCGDGDTIPCRVAAHGHRILDARDGGPGAPDRLRIGDLRGVARAAAAGETAWILVGGWSTGDPISVWTPVVVRSASAAPGDAPVVVEGTAALRAVWFDDVGTVTLRGTSLAVAEARDLWLAGMSTPVATSASLVLFNTFGAHLRLDHVTITGGHRAGAGADRLHGIIHPAGFDTRLELRHVAIRHAGDDCVTSGSDDVQIDVVRLRCQHASDDAQSASALDASGAPQGVVTARDVECVRCSEPGGFAVNTVASVAMEVDGLLVWGGRTRVGGLGARLTDVVALGAEPGPTDAFVYGDVERFVLRELVLGGNAPIASEDGHVLRDGIVQDVATGGAIAFPLRGDAALENVALVDVTTTAECAGTCATLRLGAAAPLATFRRITAAWTPALALDVPNESLPDRALHSNAASHADVAVDGLLVTGLQKAGAIALSLSNEQARQTAWGGGPCFHDDALDFRAVLAPDLPPTTVRFLAPGYADLARGRVDALPGGVADAAGCGIERGVAAPGVRHRFLHAVSRLAPERMADDADFDGVPEDAYAEPCAAGAVEGCSDNCAAHANPAQADADGDGAGDACDVACANGADDDGDGFADFPFDPSCADADDASETRGDVACDDGLDGDGDGLVDVADPGCPSPTATIEDPACDDAADNDGDGFVDFDDPECTAGSPYAERRRGCGLGAEIALACAALRRARARRRPIERLPHR